MNRKDRRKIEEAERIIAQAKNEGTYTPEPPKKSGGVTRFVTCLTLLLLLGLAATALTVTVEDYDDDDEDEDEAENGEED
ncbi:MAG: hypothetical protein ACOYJO_01995 [Eubacterium sp.]|jgi:hypothetical protein